MTTLDFEKFRISPVMAEPYPHVLVPNFVTRRALPEVVAALPVMRGRGSFPIGALRIGPAAKGLVAGLEGPEFRAITEQKFGLDLHDAPLMTTFARQFRRAGWADPYRFHGQAGDHSAVSESGDRQ